MALSGFLQSGTCYSVLQDAINARYSSYVPTVDSAGNNHLYSFVSGSWVQSVIDSSGNTVSSFVLPALAQFSACDPTIYTPLAIPSSADFAQSWSLGFVLPMALYLVSWAVGSVVNMFSDKSDY